MSIPVPMKAIEAIVQYSWADEERDYDEQIRLGEIDPGEPSHVFTALNIVREWLESETVHIPKFAGDPEANLPDTDAWMVPYEEIVESFKLAMRSAHFSEATVADICQTVEDFAVNNLGDD